MRCRVVAIVAITFIAGAISDADQRQDQLRAALRGWRPDLFGAGSVVRGSLDVAAVEREGLDAVQSCHHCPQVPFGYMNRFWKEFKREIKPGDSLVFFRSDRKSWSGLY